MPTPHEFQTPRVTEIAYRHPQEFGIPEHDPFIDDLDGLNYEEMGMADVAEFAKKLAKATPILKDVSLPPNVVNLDDYRHGPQAA
jgi:hypothetical protein